MKNAKVCNIVCALLTVLLLVLQFMPFWDTVSIQSYIWFPTDNAAVTEYLSAQLGTNFQVGSIVLMPAVVVIAGAITVGFFFFSRRSPMVSILSLICSIAAVCGYLFETPFHLGTNWVLHLAVAALLIVVSVWTLFVHVKMDKEA